MQDSVERAQDSETELKFGFLRIRCGRPVLRPNDKKEQHIVEIRSGGRLEVQARLVTLDATIGRRPASLAYGERGLLLYDVTHPQDCGFYELRFFGLFAWYPRLIRER